MNLLARIGGTALRLYVHNPKTVARFWSFVDRKGDDECWPWTGSTHPRGYGRIKIRDKVKRASQVSWEIEHGKPFPDGLCALHSCDNPNCVNPAHIRAGTHKENMEDKMARGRWCKQRSRCLRGHELTLDNVLVDNRGKRRCRTCAEMKAPKRAEYYREWRARRQVTA